MGRYYTYMTLDKEDIAAIANMIEPVVRGVDELEERMNKQFAKTNAKIDRLDRVQQAEIDRNDSQDRSINRIRKQLHAV